ncbi:MAG: DUF1801 domain-containing protein [Candidatus Bathyarchaeia archaeon]|jgi:hypothetical protein
MIKQRTIDEILSSLEPAQKETIQNLRALIKSAVPETVEIVRQGKIVYKLNDKDFVWISHYQDHVDLEFFMGASLDSDLLKSRGEAEKSENVRHITVSHLDKLKPEIVRLLKAAAAVGFEHCPTSA